MAKTPIRNLRVDDETWACWEAAAAERNFASVSEWMRVVLNGAAKHGIEAGQLEFPPPTTVRMIPAPDPPARTFTPDFKGKK